MYKRQDQVTHQMRSRAKAVNFGIVYGISAFSLSQDIGVTVQAVSYTHLDVYKRQVGSWSTPEVGQAIFDGLHSVFGPMGVYIAAQCCEHLNRALIVE